VAIGDIDHFKKVNDRFGHATGDQVLIEVSRQLSEGLRESDILARFGGEEFAIILTTGSLEAGYQVLDKLRSLIAEKPFLSSQKHEIHLSMSFGVALVDATVLQSETDDQLTESLLDAALHAADKALYDAKRQGRNKVALAPKTVYAQAI
jgi:diguanylate cyclase (GGDEF)-like protein